MRTTYTVKVSEIERDWYVVDATGHTAGRLASEVAKILRGKHKPIFTPHLDTGDHVIITNSDKIKFTGKKLDQKIYYRHSGYIGNLKQRTLKEQMNRDSTEVLKHAIKGMLPKGPLGRDMLRKLRVYAGPEHEQQAQNPKQLEIKY